jgi:hypothetical protein
LGSGLSEISHNSEKYPNICPKVFVRVIMKVTLTLELKVIVNYYKNIFNNSLSIQVSPFSEEKTREREREIACASQALTTLSIM